MPIYEYRCDACGHELDALQKLADDPLRACPDCAALALRRLISAPSFRLKGDGWYETDFKSDGETKRNLVESPEPAKAQDKGTDDKAAAQTKSKQTDGGSDSKAGSASGSNGGAKRAASDSAAA